MDPAVPVPAVVLFENLCDGGLQGRPGIGAWEAGLVVEERGPGQPGDVQKNFQPVFGLESDDSADLQRCSSSLKAFTFPRKATSARKCSFSRRNRCSSDSGSVGALGGEIGRPRTFGRKPSSPSLR